MPNNAELDALLNWAEAEHDKKAAGLPSEWDQGTWAAQRNVSPTEQTVDCGTVCCFAGKAVARAGGVFLLERPWETAPHLRADYARMPDGTKVSIEHEAERLLDISNAQAEALFDADNSIRSIRRIVQEIKDGVEYPETGEEHGDAYDDEDEDA